MNDITSSITTTTTRTRRSRAISFLAVSALLGGTIAGIASTPASAATKLNTIDITATTSALQANAPTYKPGWTKVTLKNTDKDAHQAALIRIPKGMTPAEFAAAFAAGGTKALAGTTSLGGPAIAFPGLSSSVSVNLAEGTYFAMDLVPGADGKPKATKGFMSSFAVKKGLGGSATTRPRTDATVELHDFMFKGAITLKQGTSLAVRNDGKQPHELVMFGLAPDKTADDVLSFLSNPAPSGPPPFVAATGIAGLAPKATGYLGVDVPPGKYVFLCLLPDVAGKGEPHFTKGMMVTAEVVA